MYDMLFNNQTFLLLWCCWCSVAKHFRGNKIATAQTTEASEGRRTLLPKKEKKSLLQCSMLYINCLLMCRCSSCIVLNSMLYDLQFYGVCAVPYLYVQAVFTTEKGRKPNARKRRCRSENVILCLVSWTHRTRTTIHCRSPLSLSIQWIVCNALFSKLWTHTHTYAQV